jgi:uncharacterized protein
LIKILITFFLILFAFFLLIYVSQRQLIYFPVKERPSRQIFHAEDMQEISLHTADNLRLNAWYKPATSQQPTLLYLPGNAGHIGFRMPLARQFLAAGFGVLLLEYRGYGGNKGRPTEQGLYNDGRAAMQFLQQQGVHASHLALYGESLGSGVATKLATEFPICALVLQSPFTSLSAIARYHYPWIPIKPWDRFDSLARISSIKAPLLILHGKQDRIVPFSEGLALFHAANEPKRFVPFANKGHNNLWNNYFVNTIKKFIKTHCS